jgi:hypothetical protein
MAFTAGLTDFNVFVIGVAYLADCSHAADGNITKLCRGKTKEGFAAFFCHELSGVACCSCELAASAGIELDVVNYSAYGDICKRKSIAGLDVGCGACDNGVADFKAYGLKDVSLLAVLIFEKGDECRAVGIVFDADYFGGNIKLISLEINYTILCANSAASVANGDSSVAVTAAVLLKRNKKTSFGRNL